MNILKLCIQGQYKLNFWLHNFPISSLSPIIGRTTNYSVLNEIKIYGYGVHRAQLNRPAEFFIDCSRIKDLNEYPEVSFRGIFSEKTITQNDLRIDLKKIENMNNVYKCSYTVERPGSYSINIKFNKTHVSCSPIEIEVKDRIDTSKIKISKEFFKNFVLGAEIHAVINAKEAGTSNALDEIYAQCTGPTKKIKCEILDQKDGTFFLKIKPEELGKHLIDVKFNQESVPGSPFSLRVSAPPDPSKVRVIGPGICHGVLDRFESKFYCNTKGAGCGQLSVRIRGPKGAFRVDMQRKDEKDRTIMCKYDPKEVILFFSSLKRIEYFFKFQFFVHQERRI